MALEMEKVESTDLIRVVSPESLQYFASIELSNDWEPGESALRCKFVRLGEVIVLGATIDYGKESWDGRRNSLVHLDLMWHALTGRLGDDVKRQIEETAPEDGKYLKDKWPVTDAGRSWISINASKWPTGLDLYADSYDLGRGDDNARQRTVEIAQGVLGPVIQVTTG